MPIFGSKKPKAPKPSSQLPPPYDPAEDQVPAAESPPPYRRRLQFHCQLAHGSPTGIISDFINVKELYSKIAACYGIDPAEILFCTLNTHKTDMKHLLGGQLGLDDFIFAHVKGRPKVVDIEKSEAALGLTITDNGAGYAFIKAIKEGSLMSKIEGIYIGDHVEKINDVSKSGCRHFEVAKALKEIPVGSTFSLRLVEPLKSGFSEIGAKGSGAGGKKGLGTGKQTLRLRSKGTATVETTPDEILTVAIDKINGLLESFIGINDSELAHTIWELGSRVKNPSEFASSISNSDLADFGFTEPFIFDMWGAISDAQQGRLHSAKTDDQQF